MSPELQPGLRFAWQYTVPARATVPQLYHDTPFCLDMPDVLASAYLVGMEAWEGQERICEGSHERCVIDTERFNLRVARKRQAAPGEAAP